MRRLILLVVAATAALALVGGAALAKPPAEGANAGGAEVTAKPLKVGPEDVPTEGLLAPVPSEDGKIKTRATSVRGTSGSAAASQARWLSGTSSNTHYLNPINNQIQLLTTEMVSYWGTEDGTYPKVGELYWGKVTVGNVNPSRSTPVMAEVELPKNTRFALVDNDPNMKIRCVLDNFATGTSQELTGDLCPQAPRQPGAFEPYQLAPKAAYWTIKPGEAISVIFPIYSTSELKGWAGTPADCLSSSVWAAASMEVWDAPEATDSCPVSAGDGVDQGVWVAPNPPTIQYPTPSSTNVTPTGAKTTGHLFYHFQPGTAFLDLGTTTGYGRTESLAIADTNDALAISNDWTGLQPNTTYHWRMRFVDRQGRTFTGADQTFKTAVAPDTTPPPAPTITAGPSGTVSSASATFAFSSEPGSAFRCSLDGSAWSPCSSPKGYSGIAGGPHTFKVKATDAAGNTSPETRRAWTVDTTAPRVVRVVPSENATGVAPATNVSVFFSEAMRASTVTAGTVKLYKKGSTTPVAAAVTYDVAKKKATLNPNANLQLGAAYKVVVAGTRDAAGNVLDQDPNLAGNQPKTWAFTVRR